MLDDVYAAQGRRDDDGDSLRAWGKIRLEDLSAEEYVQELTKKFKEFAQNAQKLKEQQEQEKGSEEGMKAEVADHNQLSEDVFLPGNGFEVRGSLFGLLLAFVEEFYETFLYHDPEAKSQIHNLNLRGRRNKRALTEALMAFLRKITDRKIVNLRYLLERQIIELREALEKELDPKMRQILQERLLLLTQLRMQLQIMDRRQGADHHILFMMLVAHTLAGASLDLCRDPSPIRAEEGYIALSRKLGRLFDVDNIAHDGIKREIAHAAAEFSLKHNVPYACVLDHRSADALSMGRTNFKELGISADRGLFIFAGPNLGTHGHTYGAAQESGIFARLALLVGAVLHNIAMGLVVAARDVFGRTLDGTAHGLSALGTNAHVRNVTHEHASREASAPRVHASRDRVESGVSRGITGEGSSYCSGLEFVRGSHHETQHSPYNSRSISCAFEFTAASIKPLTRGGAVLEDVTVQRAIVVEQQVQVHR
ncbi:hypothetical protein [Anaplasma capra]|uniref:hypothetical protein n=1 Tax=Anaplasma capra TaxID=1562740 RepID=UPI0021D58504|nr:hypothetical protein [Anaplasma capra]MCU7611537.1 hypothetical protein [Anaplasma capra]MCU7612024.1 hypothetical protein [Anaplasma capra]